jgi:hypothetical protein
MNHSLTTAVVSLVMLAAATHTAHCDETTSSIDPPARANQVIAGWGLSLSPIPDVLRAHCRSLRGGHGLLVDQVTPASPADQMGLESDDVILRVDGQPLSSVDELPPPAEVVEFSLLRGGRVHTLALMPANNGRLWNQGFIPPQWPMPGMRFPRTAQRPGPRLRGAGSPLGFSTSASATSIAGENQSVSISQAGDQITLEMIDPNLDDKPIRLRGTRQQIEDQLRTSDLTEAARQQVLRALGRAR